MKPSHRVIAADVWTDLGNRLINLTLMDWLVFKGSNPIWHLVGLTLIEQLPSIVLSPVVGPTVDRIGAGQCLKAALAGKCLLTLILIFYFEPGAAIAFYLLFICGSLCFNLSRLAIIPTLVKPDRLMAFNALNERVAIIGGIIAYIAMGRIIVVAGQNGALQIAAIFFAIATGTACRLTANATSGNTTTGVGKEPEPDLSPPSMDHGQITGDKTTALGLCLFLLGSMTLAGGVLNFTLPLLFKLRFEGDIGGWAVIMALYQTGAFIAAVFLPLLSSRLGLVRTNVLHLALAAAAMTTLALSDSKIWFGATLLVSGIGFTSLSITVESMIQRICPAHRRGGILSRVTMLRGICYCSTGALGAYLLTNTTTEVLLLSGVVILLAAAPAATRLGNSKKNMRRSGGA